jgi:hypothetical protein
MVSFAHTSAAARERHQRPPLLGSAGCELFQRVLHPPDKGPAGCLAPTAAATEC